MGFKSIYEAFYEDGESEINKLQQQLNDLRRKKDYLDKNPNFDDLDGHIEKSEEYQRQIIKLETQIMKLQKFAEVDANVRKYQQANEERINNLFRH